MEFDNRYASNGKGNAGVALGIIGTALGVLNGGFTNWNGGNCSRAGWGNYGECSENTPVTRYEMELQQQLAENDAAIALRDANTYGDQKLLEFYKYVDGELKEIRAQNAAQAVHNQKTEDSFALARQDIAAVKSELTCKIEREAERRRCGDNSIVAYANATFYPKMVANVTTGDTTTAQTLYNPLPTCENCCNGNNN